MTINLKINYELLQSSLRKAQFKLQASEKRFKNIIDKNADGILIVDENGIVRFINQAGKELFGYKAKDLENNYFGFPIVEGESSDITIFRDGELLSVEMRVVITEWEGEKVNLISMRDITRRKKAEEQLIHDAFHSSLTSLPNRALFMDRLGQACDRMKQKEDFTFAVLYLDIDRFKLINDVYGQVTGDKIIILVSEKLRESLSSVNTLAHLGADDFAVLVEDVESLNEVVQLINKFQDEVATISYIDNDFVALNFKIGICFGSNDYIVPEDIFRDAETAMKRAKKDESSNYNVFNKKMHIQAMKSVKIESDIRKALENNEFKIHYQPIISINTGEIIGSEPLLRWEHPEKGMIAACEFIDVAHKTGLIIQICEYSLQIACKQNQVWNTSGFSKLYTSVNISPLQLKRSDFVKSISQTLKKSSMNPDLLHLEITEHSIIHNLKMSIKILNELNDMGVKISMDDFGTGYSSISYLKRLPIDTIKIDRSFIKDIPNNSDDSAIVKAIVSLAKSLDLKIVGEGVETEKQLGFLASVGCDSVQGYLFSKAVSASDFTLLLQKNKMEKSSLSEVPKF